jgi:L-ascorbate metabolism protein UlaG (beta-lactamase superfamily)
MKLQLIRHATLMLLTKEGKILVDPVLSPAGAMPPIKNSANDRRNPLGDLPVDVAELLKIDAVLLTHMHQDHFDATAIERLPRDVPIFCQPEDERRLYELKFSRITAVSSNHEWNGIEIIRTGGEHGTGEIMAQMGPVSGYVLKQQGEPTVYITGDTVWCPAVERAIAHFCPEVVVAFAGAAQFLSGDPITMQAEDVVAVLRQLPTTKAIVVHMESFNHCLLSRQKLSATLRKVGLAERVVIPTDGEIISL